MSKAAGDWGLKFRLRAITFAQTGERTDDRHKTLVCRKESEKQNPRNVGLNFGPGEIILNSNRDRSPIVPFGRRPDPEADTAGEVVPLKQSRKNQKAKLITPPHSPLDQVVGALHQKIRFESLCIHQLVSASAAAPYQVFGLHCREECRRLLLKLYRERSRRAVHGLAVPESFFGRVLRADDLLRLPEALPREELAPLQGLVGCVLQHAGPSYYLLAFFRYSNGLWGMVVVRRPRENGHDFNHRDAEALQAELGELTRALRERETRLLREAPQAWLEEFFRLYGLSDRECEVATLALEGYKMKVMADRLCVDPVTVRDHLTHIYAKLGVRSRPAMAALILKRLGLISAEKKK